VSGYAPTIIEIIIFGVFVLASYILLRLIFNFSTYHKSAPIALVALAFFAFISGWLMFKLELHGFFMWQLIIFSVIFFSWHRKNMIEPDKLSEIATDIAIPRKLGGIFISSYLRTRKYFLLSIFVYLVTFSVSYLYFYNQV
jgi:hypothetical protein